jgi:hypothetical protein
MIDKIREKAVHAADTLNDFIGDFIGGTALFREWDTQFRVGRVPETLMINVQKICVSHLVLGLFKFVEFYERFHQVIPSEHLEACKALVSEINRKGVVEFRNKCVGHIWDKEKQRPLSSRMARSVGRTDAQIISRCENSLTTPPFAVCSIIVENRDQRQRPAKS